MTLPFPPESAHSLVPLWVFYYDLKSFCLGKSPHPHLHPTSLHLAFVAHAEGMGLLTQRNQETTSISSATDTDSRGEETIGILKAPATRNSLWDH